jgi:Bacterial protein of unknown function (DUF937)
LENICINRKAGRRLKRAWSRAGLLGHGRGAHASNENCRGSTPPASRWRNSVLRKTVGPVAPRGGHTAPPRVIAPLRDGIRLAVILGAPAREVRVSVTANLIGQFVRDFRGDTLNRLAFALGESPVRIQAGLGAVLPAIMGGLAAKASTTVGASSLIDLIRLNQFDSPDYADISAAVGAPDGIISLINAGRPAVDAALAGRTNAVIEWISSFAGINRSSSISLLTLALPLVVGQIVRIVGRRGLNAWSLKGLLAEQRALLGELPGLSVALGIGGRASSSTRDAIRRRATERTLAGDRPGTPDEPAPAWWKWAVPLALLALIVLYFWVRRPPPPQTDSQTRTAVVHADVSGSLSSRETPRASRAPSAIGRAARRRSPGFQASC